MTVFINTIDNNNHINNHRLSELLTNHFLSPIGGNPVRYEGLLVLDDVQFVPEPVDEVAEFGPRDALTVHDGFQVVETVEVICR